MRACDLWKNDKDWQRVLWCWNQYGRIGMTLQQLAYICERDPWVILKEMVKNPNTKVQLCKMIRAPVFSWYRQHACGNNSCKDCDWTLSPRLRLDGAVALAEVLLERFPYPEYKGVGDWRGLKSGTARLAPLSLEKLRAIARGEKSPLKGRH